MQEVVGIIYRPASKIYYFSPNGYNLEAGDKVIVDTAGGQAFAIVAHRAKWVEDSEVEEPLKKVLKIAGEAEEKRYEKLKQKAKNNIPVIEEKIKSLGLDMNIVDAEYSFDEVKITISFLSEGRVDFRELLKVLASTLKVKIELRQISGKEEVKMKGGLGLCGMPCCCTRFLADAEHVTVKSAKLQNISMNPTKTGGLCGKMMCCLAFEEKTYKALAEELPQMGAEVTLLDGTFGTVTGLSLLKGEFTIKVPGKDGSFKLRECTMKDIKGEDNKEEKEEPKETKKEQPKQEDVKEEPVASQTDNQNKGEKNNNHNKNHHHKKWWHKNKQGGKN